MCDGCMSLTGGIPGRPYTTTPRPPWKPPDMPILQAKATEVWVAREVGSETTRIFPTEIDALRWVNQNERKWMVARVPLKSDGVIL